MLVQIKILKVFCGDSIFIKFLGTDNKYHNVIIDGGYVKTYESVFKAEIQKIIDAKEDVDSLVLSHDDLDHIGGILAFIRDPKIDKKIIKEWWVNANINFSESTSIGLNQLIPLREFLISESQIVKDTVFFPSKEVDLFGATITILSPSKEVFEQSRSRIEEKITSSKIARTESDYKTRIEEFEIKYHGEDDSFSNKTSIAFIFTAHNYLVLLLADAIPSIVVNSLKCLGYTKDNRLKLDYLKLSHHGSRGNVTLELLQHLDCQNFLISSNGMNQHKLPNKSSLAMILRNPNRDKSKTINFYFNQKDRGIESIFKNEDSDVFQNYNFQVFYTDTINLN